MLPGRCRVYCNKIPLIYEGQRFGEQNGGWMHHPRNRTSARPSRLLWQPAPPPSQNPTNLPAGKTGAGNRPAGDRNGAAPCASVAAYIVYHIPGVLDRIIHTFCLFIAEGVWYNNTITAAERPERGIMKKIGKFIGRFLQNTDKLIWVVALGLSTLSVLLLTGIYEAGYVQLRTVQVQAIAVGIGVAGAVIAAQFDPEDLAGLWKLYVPPVALLMVMTYFMGTVREGSTNKSWLDLGFVSIQPSEFLKIAFILTFALHLSKVGDGLNEPRTLIPVLIHGAIPVGMVLIQRDAGVALIVVCILCAMLFAAGLAARYIAMAAGALVVAAPVLWFGVMSEYQKLRFLVLFDPEHDPLGITYQQNRGLTAIGSGQIFGIGIFNDNHIYVPENYNDFIFTFLGESLGFVGCFLTILALAVLCGRILHNGLRSHTQVGKFVCVGVFAMIAFQAVINIGMCLMVAPVIGITLPLLSGGGSSVLSVYAGLGLVLGVYADSNKNMFSN